MLMPTPTKNKIGSPARRREVRRHMRGNSTAPSLWQRLWQPRLGWTLVYVIVFAAVASFIAMLASESHRFEEGQILTAPLVARVQFTAVDEAKTLQRREYAKQMSPAIYRPDTAYLTQLREELESIGRYGADESIVELTQIREETRERLRFNEDAFQAIKKFVQTQGSQRWSEAADKFINDYTSIAVISSDRARIENDQDQTPSYQITITHPSGAPQDRYDQDLIDVGDEKDLKTLQNNIIKLLDAYPQALWHTIFTIVTDNPKPTYLYDSQTTQAARRAAAAAVEQVQMTYQPNDVLITPGQKLSSLDMQLINREQQAYQETIGPFRTVMAQTGRAGLILILGICLWTYTLAYKPRIADNAMRGLALTALLLAMQALAVFTTAAQPNTLYFLATFPTLTACVILAVAYDQRFALAVSGIHAALILISLKLPIEFGLVLATGIVVTVIQLNEIRSRSKLIWVGWWSGLAMAAATWLAGLSSRPLDMPEQFQLITYDALWALGSGIATGLIVQAALPAIESAFKITTLMTLKDLNDVSHPLLQRLAQLAPGTYQHSLRLADMAEAAAEAIGGTPMLCRVGAMFHDIGKMNKPQYFVENQASGANKHDKLSPAMSVLIIVGHVKDGIEMAREYDLPAPIRHFIESHHGTTLVEYFYHAAKQKSEQANDTAPTEFEFRYPGPKPQTPEAAIMMLCDGIESAARTLREPTPARIEELVTKMSRKRLMDGQFDECNLTLQELHKIETAITKTMCAVYHGRIAYPKEATEPEAEAEQETKHAAS